MTLPPPAGYEPSNRELHDKLIDLIKHIQIVEGQNRQLGEQQGEMNKNVDTMRAIMFGDINRGIERGVLQRLGFVEKASIDTTAALDDLKPLAAAVKELTSKEGERHEREVRADARQKFILNMATFLGVTNVAGIAALVAYAVGIIHP